MFNIILCCYFFRIWTKEDLYCVTRNFDLVMINLRNSSLKINNPCPDPGDSFPEQNSDKRKNRLSIHETLVLEINKLFNNSFLLGLVF